MAHPMPTSVAAVNPTAIPIAICALGGSSSLAPALCTVTTTSSSLPKLMFPVVVSWEEEEVSGKSRMFTAALKLDELSLILVGFFVGSLVVGSGVMALDDDVTSAGSLQLSFQMEWELQYAYPGPQLPYLERHHESNGQEIPEHGSATTMGVETTRRTVAEGCIVGLSVGPSVD